MPEERQEEGEEGEAGRKWNVQRRESVRVYSSNEESLMHIIG